MNVFSFRISQHVPFTSRMMNCKYNREESSLLLHFPVTVYLLVIIIMSEGRTPVVCFSYHPGYQIISCILHALASSDRDGNG